MEVRLLPRPPPRAWPNWQRLPAQTRHGRSSNLRARTAPMLERTSARFLNERPRVRIPPGLQSGPKQLGYLETNPDAFTRPPYARVSQPAEDAGSDPVCCRCKSCPWHERHEPNVFGYHYQWGGRGFDSRRARARSSVGERQTPSAKTMFVTLRRGGRRNGALLCIQRVAGSTPALST